MKVRKILPEKEEGLSETKTVTKEECQRDTDIRKSRQS